MATQCLFVALLMLTPVAAIRLQSRADIAQDKLHLSSEKGRLGEGSVVMAMCTYPQPEKDCGIFVQSLRKTGYNGAIVLGVREDFDKKFMQKYDITPKVVQLFHCEEEVHTHECMKVGDELMKPVNGRWAAFKQWMQEGKYTGYALVSGSRDVFFQADPFAELAWNTDQPVIEVGTEFGWDSEEDQPMGLGSMIRFSSFNREWLSRCTTPETMISLQENKVVCADTTMGTAKGMEMYLSLMTDEISKMAQRPGCLDQGIHNFLIHSIKQYGTKLRVEKPEWGRGTMLTIGATCVPPPSKREEFIERTGRENSWDGEELRRDGEGYVLNLDGSRAPMVHQYDRCEKQFIEDGWVEKTFNTE